MPEYHKNYLAHPKYPGHSCKTSKATRVGAARYGSYDERGVPLTDADGAEIAKSQVKKLEKFYAAHVKKWGQPTRPIPF